MVFCLAIDQEWKDSKNFWGEEECRLLQIRPQYKVIEGKSMLVACVRFYTLDRECAPQLCA